MKIVRKICIPYLRRARKTLTSLIVVFCVLPCSASSVFAAQDNEPSKELLIASLRGLYENIEKGDLDAAAKFVVMPPGMQPSDLAGLIEKRELSKDGIAHLAAKAKFGTATELFGSERAAHFANKMKVDASMCFAFNHTFDDVTAEAMALWKNGQFKLVRVDDIGKLPAAAGAIAKDSSYSPNSPGVANTIPNLSVLRYPLAQLPPPTNMPEIAIKMVELEKSVKANPNDLAAQANYAQSMFLIRSYPKAWEHLMVAYKLDPNHSGVQKGIDALVDSLTLLGPFTVGMPKDSVVGLLGEPRQVVPAKLGDRLVYAHWVVQLKDNQVHEIIDLRGATEELFSPDEIFDAQFERDWRPAFRKKQGKRSFTVMYTDDQIMNNATEQITVERILGGGNSSIKEIVAKLQSDGEKGLKTRYRVLQEDEESAIIAANAEATGGQPARHGLVKVMRGKKDLHRLTYTILANEEPSREIQMKWLGFFQKAKLIRP